MLISCRVGLLLLLTTIFSLSLFAQNNFFAEAREAGITAGIGKRVIIPEKYKTVVLDNLGLQKFLNAVSSINGLANRSEAPVLELPMPYGGTAKFSVWESAIMEPGLADKFPSIKTYTGQGIDDPTATIKIDYTEAGFHAMVLSDITGHIFIDPYRQQDSKNYIIYYKQDFSRKEPFKEIGLLPADEKDKVNLNRPMGGPCIGPQLKNYRLAVACTGEYAVAATGFTNPTVAQTLSAIVTSVNRVDGVYERELGISLNLVANNNLIIFTNSATDPFTANDDGNALLDESQTVITDKIGTGSFDIGHTFSTGAGGIAQLSSVCGGSKARGVTGLTEPFGDPYDIDYVAHEMGHQFGAYHTFNATTSSCSGNRSAETAVEPGSGITIMSYAGICGTTNNLAVNSIPYFHAVSMDEINTYTTNENGATCATLIATGNTAPVVNAGNDFIIPKSTFFSLTGTASDANNDALTYSWEQMDTGPAGNWNSPTGDAPLFRSFAPVSIGTRYFPQLSDQVRNVTTMGEILPSYGRTMNFRLTARDNRAGGGGVCYDESAITVDGNSGPFVLTAPNAAGISWEAGTVQTVTWNVANTNNAPVNCANVSILLSLDSGYTFPVTILASTPNDGSQQIIVPDNVTTKARIKVIGVGNIFYDISNNNFTITSTQAGFNFVIPASRQVNCADPAATTASITLSTESVFGYAVPINLSATNVPAGSSVSFSQTTINPGESTVVTLDNVNALPNGTYTVTVIGTSGSIIREQPLTFIIRPGAGPVISSQPANVSICEGAGASFSVASSSDVKSYQWQVSTNGGASFANVTGATSPTFTISNVGAAQDDNRYRALVTGQCNVTTSAIVVLTVHNEPSVTLTADPYTSLLPGQSTTLTANPSASTGGVVTTTWLKDQTPISVTGNELVVDVTGLGNYQVQIAEAWADGNTCMNESEIVTITATASARLFIYPSPNNGQFTVSYYNASGVSTKQSVTIYDAKGAKVYSKEFSFSGPYQLHEIDLRNRAKGIYFVVVGDAGGRKIVDGKVLIN